MYTSEDNTYHFLQKDGYFLNMLQQHLGIQEKVTKDFEKELEIVGVGYRVEKVGDNLKFSLGFSHPVEVLPLPGISFTVGAANRVKVSGIDKEVVGQMAVVIRAVRPPDAYKGKGIRYAGESVRLKAGKTVGKKA